MNLIPIPQEAKFGGKPFVIKPEVPLFVSPEAAPGDLESARLFSHMLSEIYLCPVRVGKKPEAKYEGPFIFVGTAGKLGAWEGLFVKSGLKVSEESPGPEGFILDVKPERVIAVGSDASGTFYALQALLSLVKEEDGVPLLPACTIKDWPLNSVRGVHLYMPGRGQIDFFKRFVSRFLARFRYNTIFLEVGGGMRFDSHPEINTGWMEFTRAITLRGERPKGPDNRFQDSTHHRLAEGSFLEKEEVADLVDFCRKYHIEVVPEIQSLTHSYWLLASHREFAELPDAEWPDAYCPSKPEVYDLLFDVMDEILEVMKPRRVHIGHDEWRAGGLCQLCRKRKTADLFAEDVIKIYNHLKKKGVKVCMWADHLVRTHTGIERRSYSEERKLLTDYPRTIEAAERIPKDILMLNWSWSKGPGADEELASLGFKQIYGNFDAWRFEGWPERSSREGVLGAEVSTWTTLDEYHLGKDGLIFRFLYAANTLWSKHWPERNQLSLKIAREMAEVRRLLTKEPLLIISGKTKFEPLDISTAAAPVSAEDGSYDLSGLKGGKVKLNGVPFEILGEKDAGGNTLCLAQEEGLELASPKRLFDGLIFLQVSVGSGKKAPTYQNYLSEEDTAELLGFYEIIYEDGFRATIPIRYGYNISGYDAGRELNSENVCYFGDPVIAGRLSDGAPLLLHAYKWLNPRRSFRIETLRLFAAPDASARILLIAVTGITNPTVLMPLVLDETE